MLHIFRQIAGLRRVHPVVLAQKREHAERFPFEPIYVVGKPATHFLRRFWFRQVLDQPWQLSRAEVDACTRILNKTRAELLHIYFGHIGVHLVPLIRAWEKPCVVSFHGADVLVDMNKPAYLRATQEMLRLVRRVLVRSESLRRAVIEIGCEAGKVDIVRAGIPLDEFRFRARSAPANGGWKLLQACRLIEKKGLKVTMRAFAAFSRKYPRAGLTIAGEGPMLEELQDLALALGIRERTIFTGLLAPEPLRQLYYASHIFLHPSETGQDGNQEGVPNSMLEAMATGLPVFATRHGGIPEAVSDGVSGALVPERDVNALAEALTGAVEDPTRLAQLAVKGAESVRQNFGQEEQIKNLEEIYLRTISEHA